jgi:glutamate dehydrogenase
MNRLELAINALDTALTQGRISSVITSRELITKLFQRATPQTIARLSVEAISLIGLTCHKALVEVQRLPTKALVISHRTSQEISFTIALQDCPFIVNTITESLREHGVSASTFLHPIFEISKTTRYSLSYITIDVCSEDREQKITNLLTEALSDLIAITDDFDAMSSKADAVAAQLLTHNSSLETREAGELLQTFTQGGLIFLGYSEHGAGAACRLGILRGESLKSESFMREALENSARTTLSETPCVIIKTTTRSHVHRAIRALLISIAVPTLQRDEPKIYSFIGIPTSSFRAVESSRLPCIRTKLSRLLDIHQALPHTFLHKSIVNLVNNMPKDDALRATFESLNALVNKALSPESASMALCAHLTDAAAKIITTLVIMPRDRFSTELRKKIERSLETLLGAPQGSSEYLLDISDKSLARFYFSTPTSHTVHADQDLALFEKDLDNMTRTWDEALNELLSEHHISESSYRFDDAYKALFSPRAALRDLEILSKFSSPQGTYSRVELAEDNQELTLIIYAYRDSLSVSKAVPILDNMGLEVTHERMNKVSAARYEHSIFIHRYAVKYRGGDTFNEARFTTVAAPALSTILAGDTPNDRLNQLLLSAGLDMHAIALLRAYSAYLSQINKFATRHAIYQALASTPQAARTLWLGFCTKFDPTNTLTLEERKGAVTKVLEEYWSLVGAVKDLTHDRILRGLGSLLQHSIRTNFFSRPHTIAIKLDSEHADILPLPRPRFEIYVHGPTVEGIHLRSATVARGGIRWSDRKDDFRTEVLGLMKTQKTKNAVIVPSGAKGGFIAKNLPEDPQQIRPVVESAYKDYIRALLSITDNIVTQQVVHPDNLVIYDAPDPYLVVAADKGTASFSDLANSVAVDEFSFWLGDAFASGGSFGYDHKKYAITARGAWECVQRHFKEAGIPYQETPFTVMGIGDMSGDVFGNGLLRSKQMKLIAAFDHRSIFLDPQPDPLSSFEERSRLFSLKGSSWESYDKSIISKGGGIFGRYDKEIVITAEVREALALPEDAPQVMNGETLITHILRAPVDLFWNGGIGTYVKSTQESHADVNDSANDRVRVNAHELRCRVVGEGGNLGFTQLARVEYDSRGGRINTDAIDNSAGVDLSDHEVNLKILAAKAISLKLLTKESRDILLKEIANDVTESVLDHNREHALTLSLGVTRSKKNIHYLKSLMKEMQKLGYLQRALEYLPDDEELDERARRKEGLARAELAVLMAVVKMWMKDRLLESSLLEDPALEKYLLNYFPTKVQSLFPQLVREHQLAKNITASQLTNHIVSSIGISFAHRMKVSYGASAEATLTAILAADDLLGLHQLRLTLKKLDTVEHNALFVSLHNAVTRTLRATASWLVTTHRQMPSLSSLLQSYGTQVTDLAQHAEEIFNGEELLVYQNELSRIAPLGFSHEHTKLLASFPLIIPLLEMVNAARLSGKELITVARCYAALLETLHVNQFVTLGRPIETQNRWDNELLLGAYEDIRTALTAVACELFNDGIMSPQQMKDALKKHPALEDFIATLNEIGERGVNPAALVFVSKKLRRFTQSV